jgi:hypothetical protein
MQEKEKAMPLRDHFRPPVKPRHDWDRVHGQWPAMIVLQLTGKLPPNYSAAPKVHLGSAVEIDVGTDELHQKNGFAATSFVDGGTATALWTATEPTLRVETEFPDVDEYEVRVYNADERLVAAIELVSPSNKDRPDTCRAFVAKCAALLHQHVSVTIVDVVTTRESNLYAELLEFLNLTDRTVGSPPSPIYAGACRGTLLRQRWLFEAWYSPLAIVQPLPSLPLWLADDLVVTLDLEASYEETCRVLRIE